MSNGLLDQARERDLPILYDVDDFIFYQTSVRAMAGEAKIATDKWIVSLSLARDNSLRS